MMENTEGTEILKDEVRSALEEMNRNEAAGYDGIVPKILRRLRHR